jgi:hypothetical protein
MGVFVSGKCCVLSSRGLCVRVIARPCESYRLWCVGSPVNVGHDPESSRSATGKKKKILHGVMN